MGRGGREGGREGGEGRGGEGEGRGGEGRAEWKELFYVSQYTVFG